VIAYMLCLLVSLTVRVSQSGVSDFQPARRGGTICPSAPGCACRPDCRLANDVQEERQRYDWLESLHFCVGPV